MDLNVAIFTGNRKYGEQLHRLLQSQSAIRATVIDVASEVPRPKNATPEILLFSQDLNREQIDRVIHFFHRRIEQLRTLLIVPDDISLETIIQYLSNDIQAIVLDRDKASDLVPALTQIARGNMFLSPKITMRLLHRLQELRARLSSPHGR